MTAAIASPEWGEGRRCSEQAEMCEEEEEGRGTGRKDSRLSQALLRQDRCMLGKSPGRMYVSQNALPCSPLGLLGKSPGLSIWLNNTFCHGAAPSVVSLVGITFRKILTKWKQDFHCLESHWL